MWTPSRVTWTCMRRPSYLYSNAQRPRRSNASFRVGTRSQSMERIGRPTLRWISARPSIPFAARTAATSPRSEDTLYARSTAGSCSFVANVAAKASTIVMSATPRRIFPRTVRTMYFASVGVASRRSSASPSIFVCCDPSPAACAIAARLSDTFPGVRGSRPPRDESQVALLLHHCRDHLFAESRDLRKDANRQFVGEPELDARVVGGDAALRQ